MYTSPVVPFGFGRHTGRVHTQLREATRDLRRAPPGCALRFQFLPTPLEFEEIARAVQPALMILPPVSPYSHLASAIWCAEVPVVATFELDQFQDGETVVVDFDAASLASGELMLEWAPAGGGENPGPSSRERDGRRGQQGVFPEILSEVGALAECERAVRDKASGLGVIKVERLAGDASGGLARQLAEFVARTPDFRPLRIRYFDAETGLLGLSGQWVEPKPGLGVRGVRGLADVSLREHFAAELEGLRSSDVTIVLPMVTSAEEVKVARIALGQLSRRWDFGVTVETPAAALTIAELVQEVSFVEVGLNDLSQYALAWDRNVVNEALLPHGHVAEAVALMVEAVFAACAAAGVYCTIGLDLRPSAGLAAQLRRLGVTSVSCAPPLVIPWRHALLGASPHD